MFKTMFNFVKVIVIIAATVLFVNFLYTLLTMSGYQKMAYDMVCFTDGKLSALWQVFQYATKNLMAVFGHVVTWTFS